MIEEIESYRDSCSGLIGEESLPKGSSVSSKSQFEKVSHLLKLLKESSLRVVLLFSNTDAQNSATESWIAKTRNCLNNLPKSFLISEDQKTVVFHRCTQLLPFFVSLDPMDQRQISFYPDNTGKWLNYQKSDAKIASQDLDASCELSLQELMTMSARATAKEYTRIYKKEIPYIKNFEAKTDETEPLISIADYLVNFSLNHLREIVGCTLTDNQEAKARIISSVFPELGGEEFLRYFINVNENLEFDVSSGKSRYLIELQ